MCKCSQTNAHPNAVSGLSPQHIRAFTLIELLVVISVVILLVSLVIPALANTRRSARTVLCASQLRQLTTGATEYASAHRDRIATFSWNKSLRSFPTNDADLRTQIDTAPHDQAVQVAQMVSILRELRGGGGAEVMPLLRPDFFPFVNYALLPLRSDLGAADFNAIGVCTEDAVRLSWKSESAFEEARQRGVAENDSYLATIRYRYSSSFTMTHAAYQPDVGNQVFRPSLNFNFGSLSAPLNLGRRSFADVAFPSQKVFLFDRFDRHSSRHVRFFSEPGTAQPVAFFDGSVSQRASRDANRASHPLFPQGVLGNPVPFRLPYRPQAIYLEPPLSAPEADAPDALYWYTAGGLKGVDFGGKAIDTSQMRGP